MRRIFFLACMVVSGWVILAGAQQSPQEHVGLVRDWSSRHVVFSENGPFPPGILSEPRFWQQYYRRHPQVTLSATQEQNGNFNESVEDKNHRRPARQHVRRDWSVSLGTGSGGTISGPALFGYNANGTPNCAQDYAVTGIDAAGSATQANIIGLNQLYVDSSDNGICAGTTPTVIFAYNIGPGDVSSLIAISENGQKIAFSENNTAGTSYFHVLQFSTGTGNGTSATAPATPGTGNTAVDTKIALSTGSTTGPFIDYGHDVAYVTTNSTTASTVHKFSGVFLGTPAEVTTGGWPATITGAPQVSTPVYDSVTKHVFCTDGQGYIDYVDDSVSPAVVHSGSFQFATAGIVAAPVIVDSSRGLVYAFAGSNGTNAVVAQGNTSLTAASKVVVPIGTKTTDYILEGDFNNFYYGGTGSQSTPFLYVVGNDSSAAQLPALFNIGFNSSFTLNATTANGPLALATGTTTGLFGSPLTEFYNSSASEDFLFSGVTGSCETTGITGGCIRSLNITTGFPTAVNTVILAASGGTGSITIDNSSSSAGASNVYFTPLTGKTIVKATQAGLQ